MKTTIVIVTYREDLLLLKRLVLSIYEHWKLDDLDAITVIYNNSSVFETEDFENLMLELDTGQIALKKYYSNQLWPTQGYWDWFSQQQLKLLAAEVVNTPWYIIHDSKDAYHAPASIATFFMTNNQANLPVAPGPASSNPDSWVKPTVIRPGGVTFVNEYRNAYKLMDLDFDAQTAILRCDQISTVFPAHTMTMLGLLAFLKSKLGDLFPELMRLNYRGQGRGLFTEYALISAWHVHEDKLDKLYRPLSDHPGQGQDYYRCLIGRDKTLRGIKR